MTDHTIENDGKSPSFFIFIDKEKDILTNNVFKYVIRSIMSKTHCKNNGLG